MVLDHGGCRTRHDFGPFLKVLISKAIFPVCQHAVGERVSLRGAVEMRGARKI